MKRKPRVAAFLLSAILLVTLLSACSGDGDNGGLGGIGNILPGGDKTPEVSDPEFVRTPPPVAQAEFGGVDVAYHDDGVGTNIMLDMTNVARGYVGVQATSPVSGRFMVNCLTTGEKYVYSMDTAGAPQFYPLAYGNGTYEFTVFVNASPDPANPSDQYFYPVVQTREVALESEFVPFLVNSVVVNYAPDSQAVQLSYEIAEHASSNLEVIQQVYAWIADNISYDTEKVSAVQGTNYVPNLDQILADKKGICYDYASLAAAMLRANAIPCKMIFGNVDTGQGDQVYHAWNLVWLDEAGWVAVELPNAEAGWDRIDLTFAASGSADIAQFIGNAENYIQMSVH